MSENFSQENPDELTNVINKINQGMPLTWQELNIVSVAFYAVET